MVLRVTNVQVQVLVCDDNTDCTSFIEVANLIVNENLVGKGLSSERLTVIELYLAAHFYVTSVERGGLTQRAIDGAKEIYTSFAVKPAQTYGYAATRFGVQAVVLDTSGTLSKTAANPVKAEFKVL